jgi:hypothetical protein
VPQIVAFAMQTHGKRAPPGKGMPAFDTRLRMEPANDLTEGVARVADRTATRLAGSQRVWLEVRFQSALTFSGMRFVFYLFWSVAALSRQLA